MYEHIKKKIAFIAHPRTASSATGHSLLRMGFTLRKDHHAFDPEWNLNGWKVCCTVRNPFDTLVSWYYNKPREISFDLWLSEFLEGCHYLQGQRMFYGQPYCTYVLHFETLQKDFSNFCRDVWLPFQIIPKRNVSRNRPSKTFMDHYNSDQIQKIVKRFHDDFIINDYPLEV